MSRRSAVMVVAAVAGLATGNLAGQIKDSERTLQDSTEVIGRADVTVTADQPVPEVSISLK